MPVLKHDISKPIGVDESTTQAGNTAQFVAEAGAGLDEEAQSLEQDQPGLEEGVVEEASEDEAIGNRGPLHTREAYLKKGEDLIRSLL